MQRILSMKTTIAALVLTFLSGISLAQSFPSKTVRLVVPFPAGSATDMAARLAAQYLQTAMNQNFVVENKPGAGGSIAAMEVIRSNPDGYTLLFSSNSAAASNVALLKSIPYDPNKDFTPIAGIGENMLVLMVKSDHPAKNIQEFISYASQRPGKVNAGYGSSSSQVSIAVLNKLAKIDTMMVPYKGIPLAVNDVLAGVVEFSFVDQGNAMAQSKGGKMRVLGVTSNKRSMLAPEWPALSETLPGFDITAWFAVLGPAGIPKDVVEKLNTQITNILKQNEFKEKMAGIGIQTMPMTSDQLKSHVASEVTKWIRLVKEANIQPE
ncbi:MAG: tripartite tricarboxylate transporter substrate binding protein [Betaproteobacteria bacterium]|jgi:tripartite-type tricarboxylate transporter receptor subunit TctC|nr:tripartite tricarboxylate transporter substrate binding protein [Betaproteobacteria bacterium]NBY08885.1 tripartite tricarboxylate transporter substrate binding protein [Betaproteobacteria bacterium]